MEGKQKQLLIVVGASAVVLAVVLFVMTRSDAEPPSPELARTVSEPSEEDAPVVSRGKAGAATGADRLEEVQDEATTAAADQGLAAKEKKKRRKKPKRRAQAEESAPEEDSSGFRPVRKGELKRPEKGP